MCVSTENLGADFDNEQPPPLRGAQNWPVIFRKSAAAVSVPGTVNRHIEIAPLDFVEISWVRLMPPAAL